MAIESSLRQPARPLFSGPSLYVLGVLLVLGGAFFYYLQFVSNRPAPELPLTPEAKAYVHNLKLDDVDIKASESYFKQVVVEIDGKVQNAGDRNVQVVDVYCVFYDNYGQLVLRRSGSHRQPENGRLETGRDQGLPPAFRRPSGELESRDAAPGYRGHQVLKCPECWWWMTTPPAWKSAN